MLLLNDNLHDLYRLFTSLRADPEKFPRYREGIGHILDLIEAPDRTQSDPDSFRRCLRPGHIPGDAMFHWVQAVNTSDGPVRVIREEAYRPLLSSMLRELLTHEDDLHRIHWLCDAMHNIPLALVTDPSPADRIRTEIGFYQEMYDPDFLAGELKALR